MFQSESPLSPGSSEKKNIKSIRREATPDKGLIHLKRENELTEQLTEVRNEVERQMVESPMRRGQDLKRLDDVLDYVISAGISANRRMLQSRVMENPRMVALYAEVLGSVRRKEERELDRKIEKAFAGKKVNPEIKKSLDARTIRISEKLTQDQIATLRKSFPSGNFLLHSASIDNVLEILQSGALLTSTEVEMRKKRSWGRGGQDGISFNTNDVRVLTGTARHFAGFLVSPESVLDTKGRLRLVVPESAALYETRLVGDSYDVQQEVYQSDSGLRLLERLVGVDVKAPKGERELETLPRIPLEDAYLFCNERDVEKFKKLFAAIGRQPKGIITYPGTELRVESWLKPVGDHQRSGELLRAMLNEAGLEPSINWEKDLFPKKPNIIRETYVDSDDILRARAIINSPKGLKIIEQNQRAGEFRREAS